MRKEVIMGWFHDKYGEDAHPIIPCKMYGDLYDEFGEEAANETLCDVQDGKVSVELLEKYLYKK